MKGAAVFTSATTVTLLFATPTPTFALDGGMMWGGDGGGDDMAMMNTAMEAMAKCEVDVEEKAQKFASISNSMAMTSDGQFDIGSIAEAVAKEVDDVFGESCSEDQANSFTSALTQFETCSGISMMQFFETLPSAIVGSAIECIDAYARTVEHDAESSSSFGLEDLYTIPDGCMDVVFGANPLGDMLRGSLLKPDELLPCFQEMSENIPLCTVHMWPIPLVGSLWRTVSCILGASVPILEGLCLVEMNNLNQCLRESESCEGQVSSCSESFSLFMSMPPGMIGMPLPDICIRVANENLLSGAVERYDSLRNSGSCIEVWSGWESPPSSLQFDPTSTAAKLNFEATSPSGKEEESSGSSGGGGGKSFMWGLVVGMSVLGGAWAYVARKQRNQPPSEPRNYNTLEMNDLHLDPVT